MPSYLQSYGCTTGAGVGVGRLRSALVEGRSFVQGGVSRIPHRYDFAAQECIGWLTTAAEECRSRLGARPAAGRVGVILASTKGAIEDYLNHFPQGGWEFQPDPMSAILRGWSDRLGVKPVASLVVSNACASSHGALYLADQWLTQGRCDGVWIGAVDYLGPFIEKGFRSLQAICHDRTSPFTAQRDGLALGEGAAALWLTAEPAAIELAGIALSTEGISLTRPSESGIGLEEAARSAQRGPWDLIIAHGTGTQRNDIAEDGVFQRVAPEVPITGTKWCVGHTLGASGAIDVIAACLALEGQAAFPLATGTTRDPQLKGNYLFPGAETRFPMERVLVSSLGFGGTNAAATLRRRAG